MKELVRLNKRPSNDGSSFTFVLRYTDECGNRRWNTLGHSDFRTTHKYYLAVADNLKDRAREVTARGLCKKLVQIGATDVWASKQR
jgi:hypothetical protein